MGENSRNFDLFPEDKKGLTKVFQSEGIKLSEQIRLILQNHSGSKSHKINFARSR